MALTFDHFRSRIVVGAPQASLTIQELVNAARVEEAEHLTKRQIVSASGKEALASGVKVGITCTLLDDWQIEWWPGNYTATISGGNLVAESGDSVAYVEGGPQVEITLSAAATITQGEGGGITAEEIAAAVWQRLVEGSMSAEQMLRTLTAFAVGNATVPSGAGSFSFRDQANSKNRIEGTVDAAGNRIVTKVDGA